MGGFPFSQEQGLLVSIYRLAMEIKAHRPRNIGWARAAALLYGDWGTSKAYVIGAAFLASGFASLPIILAVCGLTALVAWNYVIICGHFPDGGGVYSSARMQRAAKSKTHCAQGDFPRRYRSSPWHCIAGMGRPLALAGTQIHSHRTLGRYVDRARRTIRIDGPGSRIWPCLWNSCSIDCRLAVA